MKATPLTIETFLALVYELGQAGFAGDIEWSEDAAPPTSPEDFALEAIFVVCNGGMKNTVARLIYDRVVPLVTAGGTAADGFKNVGKARSIDKLWTGRQANFDGYMAAEDKVEFCETLPHIGKITKFHLAKNFGADVAKPDVHLQRLADHHRTTAQALCERLAGESGYKARTVDVVLWRACATGLIDSTSGEVQLP